MKVRKCSHPGCNQDVVVAEENLSKPFLCLEHMPATAQLRDMVNQAKIETSGGHVDYYSVEIKHPNKKGRQPYIAECQDIIEALGLDFNQGELLKSVWRLGAQIKLGKQKAGDTPLRNAEKCEYYGHRTAEVERQKQPK